MTLWKWHSPIWLMSRTRQAIPYPLFYTYLYRLFYCRFSTPLPPDFLPVCHKGGGDVPSFSFNIIDPTAPFDIAGIDFIPLIVHHGAYMATGLPYLSLGFRFGQVSYISDASFIPESTRELICGSDVFICDALRRRFLYFYFSRFSKSSLPIFFLYFFSSRSGRAPLVTFQPRTSHSRGASYKGPPYLSYWHVS